MEKLNSVIFYTIDKTIKTYRMYAQKKLRENGFKITIDQWLVLKSLQENPEISQQELAKKVFKDNASVTRIIELLVKANYLHKYIDSNDRRKSNLKITSEGNLIIKKVQNVVLENRKNALKGITEQEIELVNSVLNKITDNCD